MRKRGITLIELISVVVCMAIIIGASSTSVYTAIVHTSKVKASRAVYDRNALFEDRLRAVIENAYLSSDATDTKSYFIGGQNVSQSAPGQSSDENQLVFTGLSSRIPSEVLESTDDFETLNSTYGPEGGVSEYALSLTPIGDSPVDTALFLRKQTPADGDNSQGGYQSVLDPDIDTISYEFYNGTDWDVTWDTQTTNIPRLPAAVRITYRRRDDSTDHYFIVKLIHSDVTPDNPVTSGEDQ